METNESETEELAAGGGGGGGQLGEQRADDGRTGRRTDCVCYVGELSYASRV